MGHKGSSTFLHKHVTEPCLWPNGFSPHTEIICVKFNLTLLYHLHLSLQIGIISLRNILNMQFFGRHFHNTAYSNS
jgi:hypothetical protein